MRTHNGHKIACTLHVPDSPSKHIVIFCHGYRGSSIGPGRLFVTLARMLSTNGIASLRFDQYGSGNSEGDFYSSSFLDWIQTTSEIVEEYQNQGYKVSLLGQSMGAATVIAVASKVPTVCSFVAWAPDPNVEKFILPAEGYFEEGGQRVQAKYWSEAYKTNIAQQLRTVAAPGLIIQCENDEYVSKENHEAIARNAQPHHYLEMLRGHKHSTWSFEQGQSVLEKSIRFILQQSR